MFRRIRLWSQFCVMLAFTLAGGLILLATHELMALASVLFFGAGAFFSWVQIRDLNRRRMIHAGPILDGDRIVLHGRAGTVRAVALFGVVTTAALAMTFWDEGPVYAFAGVTCFVLACWGSLIILRNSWYGLVVLRVDERGISFGKGRHPRLRWDQIGSIGMVSMGRQKVLGFTAREGVDAHADDNAFLRISGLLGRKSGLPDFYVVQTGLDVRLRQVAAAVERLRERYT